MKEDRYTIRAEEIHTQWCAANTDHKREIAMMAKALRECAAEAWNQAAEESSKFASDSQNLGQHWAANQCIDLAVSLRSKSASLRSPR